MRAIKPSSLFYFPGFRLFVILAACLSGLLFLASLATANDLPLLLEQPAPTGMSRRWSAARSISPYSTVDLNSGRVLTAIPVTGWGGGRGPGISLTFYHNMTSDWAPPYIQSEGKLPSFKQGGTRKHHPQSHIGGIGAADASHGARRSRLTTPTAPTWSHTYQTCLVVDLKNDKATLIWGDGTQDVYTTADSGLTYTAPAGIFNALEVVGSDPVTGYTVTTKSQMVYSFDDNGRLDTISDASGNEVTCHYLTSGSAEGELNYVEDASGRLLEFSYRKDGSLYHIDDPGVNIGWTCLYYDSKNPEVPSDAGDGPFAGLADTEFHKVTWTYTADYEIETITDKNESTYEYEYGGDETGRLTQVTYPPEAEKATPYVYELSYIEFYTYDKIVTTYLDERGNDWNYVFSTNAATQDNLMFASTPLGRSISFTYDTSTLKHEKLTVTNALSNTWTMTHDAVGNVLTITDPLSHKTTYEYDCLNNLMSVSPPSETPNTSNPDKTVTYVYGDVAHPTSVREIHEPLATDEKGEEEPITYIEYYGTDEETPGDDDAWNGLVKSVTPPYSTSGGAPVASEFTYDEFGQPATQWEGAPGSLGGGSFLGGPPPEGVGTDITCDTMGRAENSGGGSTNSYCTYDALGNLLTVVCRDLTSPSFSFGGPDPCSVMGATENCVVREYQPLMLSGCTNSNIQYTDMSQITYVNKCVEDPITFASTPRAMTFDYDALYRLTTSSVSSAEASKNNGLPVEHGFTYDYSGWVDYGVVTRTRTEGGVATGETTTIAFNEDGQISSVEKALDKVYVLTANYDYYDDGRLETVAYGNGTQTTYTYDDAGRVESIEQEVVSNSHLVLLLTYTYKADGLIDTMEENYLASALPFPLYGFAETFYTYDNRNRLMEEERTGVNAYDYTYTYDLAGNRLTKTFGDDYVVTEYTYDVSDPGTWGSQGNRLMYSVTTDYYSGFFPSVTEQWYHYDIDGRVDYVAQRKDDDEDGSNNQYFRGTQLYYNANGQIWISRLARWIQDGSGNPDNVEYLAAMEYRYDGAQQRYLVRPRNPQNLEMLQGESGKVQYPLYEIGRWSDYDSTTIDDDYTVTATRDKGGTITDVTPNLSVSHFVGTAQFEHDGKGGGAESYLENNHLGTLMVRTDDGAEALARPTYTAFGEHVSGSDEPGTRFGYVGAHGYGSAKWDGAYGECPAPTAIEDCDPLAALGWLHIGARYYDPASGRFVQRDPIGIEGGDNTYAYVGNEPLLDVDPEGLERYLIQEASAIGHEALILHIGKRWIRVEFGSYGKPGPGDNLKITFSSTLCGLLRPRDNIIDIRNTYPKHDVKTLNSALKYKNKQYFVPFRCCWTIAEKLFNDSPPNSSFGGAGGSW